MFVVNRIFIVKDGVKVDMSSTFHGLHCNSYEEVQEALNEMGFTHYLFTLNEVKEGEK